MPLCQQVTLPQLPNRRKRRCRECSGPRTVRGLRTCRSTTQGVDQPYQFFLDAMTKGQGKTEVAKVIAFLESYVVTHFGTEEDMMKASNFPGFVAHKAQHSAFIRDFQALKGRLSEQGGNAALAIQVQTQLGDWLSNHIAQIDKRMGAYLATHAPAQTPAARAPR